MYNIEFSKLAEKQLSKLERGLQERVVATLGRIRIRPYLFVIKLVGSPYFRLRAGDYRLILNIKDDQLIILVIELGHRSVIYK